MRVFRMIQTVAAPAILAAVAAPVMLATFAAPAALADDEAAESTPEAEAVDPDPPPPGVERLLRRGGIPAVFDPVFVSAQEARLPDDAMVLGVALDGDAHAYSLNLLNQHEVVNDRIGELHFAAVW